MRSKRCDLCLRQHTWFRRDLSASVIRMAPPPVIKAGSARRIKRMSRHWTFRRYGSQGGRRSRIVPRPRHPGRGFSDREWGRAAKGDPKWLHNDDTGDREPVYTGWPLLLHGRIGKKRKKKSQQREKSAINCVQRVTRLRREEEREEATPSAAMSAINAVNLPSTNALRIFMVLVSARENSFSLPSSSPFFFFFSSPAQI